ncbi:hypothetical protein Q1695_005399 [Nippostrongylus brasiliensis]|nr:hypothetical protein Q1695_005399 [Nippostrongylus brasiliensis]
MLLFMFPSLLILLFLLIPSCYSCMSMAPQSEATLSRSVARRPSAAEETARNSVVVLDDDEEPQEVSTFREASAKSFDVKQHRPHSSPYSPPPADGSGQEQITNSIISSEDQFVPLFEHDNDELSDEEGICNDCPPLFMKKNSDESLLCSNWRYVQNSFGLTVTSTRQSVQDNRDNITCSRVVSCEEPYMLVRWFNSSICDVHSFPTAGGNSFTYDCNGTSWNMRGFPVGSVICAKKLWH